MQITGKKRIIITRDGWCICPICGKGKLLKVTERTKVHSLPAYCKLCHQETILNIECARATEPEPID